MNMSVRCTSKLYNNYVSTNISGRCPSLSLPNSAEHLNLCRIMRPKNERGAEHRHIFSYIMYRQQNGYSYFFIANYSKQKNPARYAGFFVCFLGRTMEVFELFIARLTVLL